MTQTAANYTASERGVFEKYSRGKNQFAIKLSFLSFPVPLIKNNYTLKQFWPDTDSDEDDEEGKLTTNLLLNSYSKSNHLSSVFSVPTKDFQTDLKNCTDVGRINFFM